VATINLIEILEQKQKSLYWLAKRTGIAHKTLYRYAHAQSGGIQLDDLDKICTALKCGIAKLITVEQVDLAKPEKR
jgi:putative transcriptional regulator